jgi:hypothetical protein
MQQPPADTFGYMVLGYAVILGSIAVFIASLAVRFRSLAQDLQVLEATDERH